MFILIIYIDYIKNLILILVYQHKIIRFHINIQ